MRVEFETLAKLKNHLAAGDDVRRAVFQGLDLTEVSKSLQQADLQDCVFLGCQIDDLLLAKLQAYHATIFPKIPDTPFQKYRGLLYTPEELQGDYALGDELSYDHTVDGRIYNHFLLQGPNPDDVVESLTRRLHDLAITDALQEFIAGKQIVAIMGGHSMLRSDPLYGQVAQLGRTLTQLGFLVTTGGGPGAMEAAHLGAWFATRSEAELSDAVTILSDAPLYKPKGKWLDAAVRVAQKYPVQDRDACQSLGIPTWLYGHEPPAHFALTIAKYFANSVREEGLLAIAQNGVVFTPGSAGTIQEIFQDACQNHYKTFGGPSPMVFMGHKYWSETKPVFPLLKHLAKDQAYDQWLSIHDQPDDIVAELQRYRQDEQTA